MSRQVINDKEYYSIYFYMIWLINDINANLSSVEEDFKWDLNLLLPLLRNNSGYDSVAIKKYFEGIVLGQEILSFDFFKWMNEFIFVLENFFNTINTKNLEIISLLKKTVDGIKATECTKNVINTYIIQTENLIKSSDMQVKDVQISNFDNVSIASLINDYVNNFKNIFLDLVDRINTLGNYYKITEPIKNNIAKYNTKIIYPSQIKFLKVYIMEKNASLTNKYIAQIQTKMVSLFKKGSEGNENVLADENVLTNKEFDEKFRIKINEDFEKEENDRKIMEEIERLKEEKLEEERKKILLEEFKKKMEKERKIQEINKLKEEKEQSELEIKKIIEKKEEILENIKSEREIKKQHAIKLLEIEMKKKEEEQKIREQLDLIEKEKKEEKEKLHKLALEKMREEQNINIQRARDIENKYNIERNKLKSLLLEEKRLEEERKHFKRLNDLALENEKKRLDALLSEEKKRRKEIRENRLTREKVPQKDKTEGENKYYNEILDEIKNNKISNINIPKKKWYKKNCEYYVNVDEGSRVDAKYSNTCSSINISDNSCLRLLKILTNNKTTAFKKMIQFVETEKNLFMNIEQTLNTIHPQFVIEILIALDFKIDFLTGQMMSVNHWIENVLPNYFDEKKTKAFITSNVKLIKLLTIFVKFINENSKIIDCVSENTYDNALYEMLSSDKPNNFYNIGFNDYFLK